MARKFKRKKKPKTPKSIAWDWMSRWVRLTAVIETCDKFPSLSPKDLIAQCCTCGKLASVRKKGGIQAGHWQPRGSGGGSGTYFHECNVGPQCGQCNGFEGGKPEEFKAYLIKRHNKIIVQELESMHKLPSRWGSREYPGLTLYYREKVEQILKETGARKWW